MRLAFHERKAKNDEIACIRAGKRHKYYQLLKQGPPECAWLLKVLALIAESGKVLAT